MVPVPILRRLKSLSAIDETVSVPLQTPMPASALSEMVPEQTLCPELRMAPPSEIP